MTRPVLARFENRRWILPTRHWLRRMAVRAARSVFPWTLGTTQRRTCSCRGLTTTPVGLEAAGTAPSWFEAVTTTRRVLARCAASTRTVEAWSPARSQHWFPPELHTCHWYAYWIG